ncbi:MAG: hypothetical protein ACYTEI_13930 [Planctomycetota bacterium]|jgi:hypothetical protein
MSGFLSSKYLKYRRPEYQVKVEGDLPCTECGYNLRGLNYGRNCPECGLAIEPEDAVGDVLRAASWSSRGAVRLGLTAAFGCLVAAVAARFVLFFGGFTGISPELARTYLATGLVLSVAWTIAAWMITPRRLDGRRSGMRALRLVVRSTQPLWVVGYVCWLVAIIDGDDQLAAWGRGLRFLAGVGAIVLAVVLCRVAGDAGREHAARRLNAAAWILPITTLLPQLFPRDMAWFGLIPLGLLLLLWAWVMMLYALGVLDLQRHVSWAPIHAAQARTRSRRVAEKRAAADRELEASIRPFPSLPPEIPLDPPDGPRQQ